MRSRWPAQNCGTCRYFLSAEEVFGFFPSDGVEARLKPAAAEYAAAHGGFCTEYDLMPTAADLRISVTEGYDCWEEGRRDEEVD